MTKGNLTTFLLGCFLHPELLYSKHFQYQLVGYFVNIGVESVKNQHFVSVATSCSNNLVVTSCMYDLQAIGCYQVSRSTVG